MNMSETQKSARQLRGEVKEVKKNSDRNDALQHECQLDCHHGDESKQTSQSRKRGKQGDSSKSKVSKKQ